MLEDAPRNPGRNDIGGTLTGFALFAALPAIGTFLSGFYAPGLVGIVAAVIVFGIGKNIEDHENQREKYNAYMEKRDQDLGRYTAALRASVQDFAGKAEQLVKEYDAGETDDEEFSDYARILLADHRPEQHLERSGFRF